MATFFSYEYSVQRYIFSHEDDTARYIYLHERPRDHAHAGHGQNSFSMSIDTPT